MRTESVESVAQVPEASETEKTVISILLAISFSHLLNDTIQSLVPAIYPVVKESFHLSFRQIGLITLTGQLTASLLQPVVGHVADRRPQPYALAGGMCFSLCGLVLLSTAGSFLLLLISVALVGVGSSVFHPEASRLAYMAAGGRRGFAQALFQVGGNAGTALGPLLAAMIVVGEHAQARVVWFSIAAVMAIIVLWNVGHWYRKNMYLLKPGQRREARAGQAALSKQKLGWSLAILVALMFSKFFYLSSMGSYYTFYLIHKFDLTIRSAQLYLFLFLFSTAAGTFIGGPIGDRFGRKYVIWTSILGVAPFTLLLPHANLFWTAALSVMIGLILSSAFSAILVYAQELLPGKVGLIAGLFFGLAFGMGGLGAAVFGSLADKKGIDFVFQVSAFLPLIGLLTGFLPHLETESAKRIAVPAGKEA
ncbi:MAG TPA: MFS transporter [Verrucomicrobiae bacterium]|jgi:FSR family fosmidomycin resistance protein-like MFS transporter|nr:MFS transporter [Verrucomicrobiae bacterium]